MEELLVESPRACIDSLGTVEWFVGLGEIAPIHRKASTQNPRLLVEKPIHRNRTSLKKQRDSRISGSRCGVRSVEWDAGPRRVSEAGRLAPTASILEHRVLVVENQVLPTKTGPVP